MGSTNASYLGSVGRGGTSNQTNASLMISRARRGFRQSGGMDRQSTDFSNFREARAFNERELGRQRSIAALRDWEDSPFGPALTYEAVNRRRPNRLRGNRDNPTLIDRARLRPAGSSMTKKEARTGGDKYIQMRFNEPNYKSR